MKDCLYLRQDEIQWLLHHDFGCFSIDLTVHEEYGRSAALRIQRALSLISPPLHSASDLSTDVRRVSSIAVDLVAQLAWEIQESDGLGLHTGLQLLSEC